MPDWLVAVLFTELAIEKAQDHELVRGLIHLWVACYFVAKFAKRKSDEWWENELRHESEPQR